MVLCGTVSAQKPRVFSMPALDSISVFTAPSVKPGKKFMFFDPIASLGEEAQWRWTQPAERRAMMDAATA
jgi:hypothetical protein